MPAQNPPPASRAAFTLVELLVVIMIVAVLIGLLLPAVHSARESARRTACSNNLKQLATAVLAYEAAHGRLPAAAKVTENTSGCLGCFDPWAEARLGSFPSGTKHGTSWMLEILPHLEATGVFDAWDRGTNVLGNAAAAQTDIAGFYCPTRRSGIRVGDDDHLNLVDSSWRGGGTDYGGCYGRLDGFYNSDAATAAGDGNHRFCDMSANTLTPKVAGGVKHSSGLLDGLFRATDPRAAAAARDGLSNTLMLGEMQRLRPLPGASGAAAYNRRSFDGWATGGVATLFVTTTDPGRSNPGGLNNGFFESPGSDHVGGAFFAMADGSVHFLSEFIDARDNQGVFPLLGSIRDGEIASLAVAD